MNCNSGGRYTYNKHPMTQKEKVDLSNKIIPRLFDSLLTGYPIKNTPKKRVFSTEKYLEWCEKFSEYTGTWYKQCEGIEAVFSQGSSTCEINDFTILKEWTVEVDGD